MSELWQKVFSNNSYTVAFAIGAILIIWWPSHNLDGFLNADTAGARDIAEFGLLGLFAITLLLPLYFWRARTLQAWSDFHLGVLAAFLALAFILAYYTTETAGGAQSRAVGLADCLSRAGDGATARGHCYVAFGGGANYPVGLILIYCLLSCVTAASFLWALFYQKKHIRSD